MQNNNNRSEDMNLPADLVLVRHGQSAENVATTRSMSGDHSLFTDAYRGTHTSNIRLTPSGRRQSRLAGRYLAKHLLKDIGGRFERYISSPYARAMETAAFLDLSDAMWEWNPLLGERDWGDLLAFSSDEIMERFGNSLRLRQSDPFFWRPPNGESFMQLCMRMSVVLETLCRPHNDDRILVVTHGEVMQAFQIMIEHLDPLSIRRLLLSKDPQDVVYNCQINHYTRRNPATGELMQHIGWVRRIRSTETPTSSTGWQPIEPSGLYTNTELKKLAKKLAKKH